MSLLRWTGTSFMRRTGLALGVVSMLLSSGCGVQQVQSRAREQATAGQYEAAVQTLEKGAGRYPESVELRTSLLKSRADALTKLLTQAAAERAQGRYDQAEAQLRRAQALAPDSARVRDLSVALDTERRQGAALQEAQQVADKGQPALALRIVNEALKGNAGHPGLLTLQRKLELQQRQQFFASTRQSLSETRPISLDFRETGLRNVLDLVSRHSGINFVLDKDIRSDLRVTVFLRDAKVEDALDLLVGTHQLAKKVLDEKTVLIYPNTPEKQREYREQVIKVFYLSSAEAKQAASFLRQMLKIQDPFIDEKSNMVALRESPDVIQIAERLMAVYDTGEPEVVLEMELLEVNSTRLTELGIKFPDSITLTPLAPSASSGGGSSSTGAGLTIGNLRDIGADRIGVSVAGLLINLRREVGDVETLANPRVRARNKEKAKVMIGSKLPVVTTTSTASGFVSDSVSYLDVGIKLEVEPTVYADDDVAIKIGLEVSSISNQIRTGSGGLAYEIGTRNATTTLRLHDGETQVLAGLINRQERTSSSRVPGLGDVPVVGRLFSSQLDNGSRTEVVFAITPRIVRNLRRPEANESELWVGTEAYSRLRAPGGRAWGVDRQDAAAPESRPPAADGASAPAAAQAMVPPGAPSSDVNVPPAKPAIPPIQSRWHPMGPLKKGQEAEVALIVNSPLPVRGVGVGMYLDKTAWAVSDIKEGEWLTSDQSAASISKAADDQSGQLQFGAIRHRADGVKGEGVAVRMRLKPLKAGSVDLPSVRVNPIASDVQVPEAGVAQAVKVEVLP